MADDVHPVFERCDFVIDKHQEDAGPETIGADPDLEVGARVAEFEDGSSVTFEGVYEKRSAGVPDTLMLAVELASGVGVGVLASWIYDKVKGEDGSISTPRGTIHTEGLSKEELKMAVELLFEIERDSSGVPEGQDVYCPSCGEGVDAGDAFCRHCGCELPKSDV